MKREASFFLSLIVFVLLMCACGTKREAVRENRETRFISDISVLNEAAKGDRATSVKVAETGNMTVIRERVTAEVYDTSKDSNPIVVRMIEEREYMNDATMMSRDMTDSVSVVTDSVSENHSIEADEKATVERETVKEESGFFASMGKWCGIGAVAVFVLVLVWKKLKKILSVN